MDDPFPSFEDQAKMVAPFEEWTPRMITIPTPPKDVEYTEDNVRNGLNGWADDVIKFGRDSYGNPLLDLGVDHTTARLEEQRRARQKRVQNTKNKFNQTSLEDAFKFGLEDTDWTETRTCSVNTDISRPPFERLHEGALDFFYSRTRAWENMWTRSKWNSIRYLLGIKTDFPGLHWPGSGPNPQWYSMTHLARKHATKKQQEESENWEIGEICPLIRCPELAVRGFIAMLRRDMDSLWEAAKAVETAEIFAALMGYLEFYGVLSDAHIAPAFKRAVKLAKAGPRVLREAFKLEEEVDQGFNRACWTLTGGSYLDRDTDWQLPPPEEYSPPLEPLKIEAKGWDAGDSTELRLTMTSEQAKDILTPLVAPLAVDSLRLLNYIAYGRRVVTAVFLPEQTGGSAFKSTFYRLRTVPAPWTEEERWREPSPMRRAEMERNAEAGEPEEHEGGEHPTFELEQNTIAEPAELDFWVDGKALGPEGDASWLVGMALRARWAQVGVDEENSWWITRLKDYILPSVWRARDAEREVAKGDVPLPFDQPQYSCMVAATNETANDATNNGTNDVTSDTMCGATNEATNTATSGTTKTIIPRPANDTGSQTGPHFEPIPLEQGDDDDDLPGVIDVDAGAEDEGDPDFGGEEEDESVMTAVITHLEAPNRDDEGDEGAPSGAKSDGGRSLSSSGATRVELSPLAHIKVTPAEKETSPVDPSKAVA